MVDPRAERALPNPLLGEWACLGILYDRPAHGWAIASRLRPDTDIGRIWHLTRPLTYRSIDQLIRRGWIHPVAHEPGRAGPNRTVLAATRAGRGQFRTWTRTPIVHLRNIRSELLLKLVLAEHNHIDTTAMLDHQRAVVDRHAASLRAITESDDLVNLWRLESTHAARRFIDRIQQERTGTTTRR